MIAILIAIALLLLATPAQAQNRGVYPLGMSATNSGVTPEAGFSYVNQLLFYSRDQSRGPDGEALATGNNSVILAMNSFVWVSEQEILGGARFSMSASSPDHEQRTQFGYSRRDRRRRRIRRLVLSAVHSWLAAGTRGDSCDLWVPRTHW